MHIIYNAHCTYSTYLPAYYHNLPAYYFAYYLIFCIFCRIKWTETVLCVFHSYFYYRLVPYPRAQLFTYHHLHPSPLFLVWSQTAQGKSADPPSISKGIIPISPTGTRGRRPSMEETRTTYKTCACSVLDPILWLANTGRPRWRALDTTVELL